VEVVAASDLQLDRAKAVETQYGIPALATETILAEPTVELVLNLTPIADHTRVTQAALQAGKHVYSEKPLAHNLRDAQLLANIATRNGLMLAVAPDTVLGSSFQAARRAIERGNIGTPLAATAYLLRPALVASAPGASGSTPFYDMGPYYLTALINLFGCTREVCGFSRQTGQGQDVEPPGAPSVLAGTLEFHDRLFVNLVLAWGTTYQGEVSHLSVFGSDGVLRLANPNTFGEPAFYRQHGREEWTEVDDSREQDQDHGQRRGLGVGDLARVVRTGGTPRCDAKIALHVVNILDGMLRSASTRANVRMVTTCEKAPALTAEEREGFWRN
jgi:predicted dehydrogenase